MQSAVRFVCYFKLNHTFHCLNNPPPSFLSFSLATVVLSGGMFNALAQSPILKKYKKLTFIGQGMDYQGL